jgi:hypothetical protein
MSTGRQAILVTGPVDGTVHIHSRIASTAERMDGALCLMGEISGSLCGASCNVVQQDGCPSFGPRMSAREHGSRRRAGRHRLPTDARWQTSQKCRAIRRAASKYDRSEAGNWPIRHPSNASIRMEEIPSFHIGLHLCRLGRHGQRRAAAGVSGLRLHGRSAGQLPLITRSVRSPALPARPATSQQPRRHPPVPAASACRRSSVHKVAPFSAQIARCSASPARNPSAN